MFTPYEDRKASKLTYDGYRVYGTMIFTFHSCDLVQACVIRHRVDDNPCYPPLPIGDSEYMTREEAVALLEPYGFEIEECCHTMYYMGGCPICDPETEF